MKNPTRSLSTAAAAAPAWTESSDTVVAPSKPDLRGPRANVLVIDDFDGVRNSFAIALENAPVDLSLAPDGETALALLDRTRVDLVYLDLKMPGIDGVETLRRIRERYQVPIYVLTAFADEYWARLGTARGDGLEFELLLKPLDLADIYDVTAMGTGAFTPRRRKQGH